MTLRQDARRAADQVARRSPYVDAEACADAASDEWEPVVIGLRDMLYRVSVWAEPPAAIIEQVEDLFKEVKEALGEV